MMQSKKKQGTTEPSSNSTSPVDKPSHVAPAKASTPRRRRRLRESSASFPELLPFSRRLEAVRLERGLTQRALAARASISGNHYQEIAYARANPTVIVALRLAEALEVSLDDLFDPVGSARGEQRRSVLIADLEALVVAHRQLGRCSQTRRA